MTDIVRAAPTVEVMVHAGVPEPLVDRPLGRLFVLLCERYDLDPALKQLEVISSGGGLQVYITADGYRHIALASGELDGITIPDTSRGEHGWRAHVQVWKKGCAHPFDGRAGCGDVEHKDDPEAQAITRATRRALRNAFDPVRVEAQYADLIRDSDVVDEIGTDPPQTSVGPDAGGAPPPPAPSAPGPTPAPPLSGPVRHERQRAARDAYNMLDPAVRQAFRRKHRITDLELPWPDTALNEILGRPA